MTRLSDRRREALEAAGAVVVPEVSHDELGWVDVVLLPISEEHHGYRDPWTRVLCLDDDDSRVCDDLLGMPLWTT